MRLRGLCFFWLALAVNISAASAEQISAHLAAACSGCHSPRTYNIEIFTADEIRATLMRYQTEKGSTVMHRLMRGYSDEDIARLATYLGKEAE